LSIYENQSVLIQVKYRFFFSFLVFGFLATVLGFVFHQKINADALDFHRANASRHYVKVIADLERRWGRAAFNFKIRLESESFLSFSLKDRDKLQVYLTAQGGSTEFPSLRIDDLSGKTIFTYEYFADSLPKVFFLPDQDATWVFDSEKNKLFLVIRQLIWLGNINGYLLLFHPMDHALLSQISYPDTQLSLWWNDKPVASSEGEYGLSKAKLSLEGVKRDRSVFFVSWSGVESAKTPKILIDLTTRPPVDQHQLAIALTTILCLFLVSCWSILGNWGLNNIKRIQALERAQRNFETHNAVDEVVENELSIAHSYKNDEISSIVIGSQKLMNHIVRDSK
jgi:hypothetical protein